MKNQWTPWVKLFEKLRPITDETIPYLTDGMAKGDRLLVVMALSIAQLMHEVEKHRSSELLVMCRFSGGGCDACTFCVGECCVTGFPTTKEDITEAKKLYAKIYKENKDD